jgi:hypothetical protein
MFTKIVVALNDLPESQRALRTAIELVRVSNAELVTVSILRDLPASFAIVVDPTAPDAMKEDRRRAQSELHERASQLAQQHGVRAKGSIIEDGRYRRYFISLKMKVPICLLLDFISTTSLYPDFGVLFMTLPRTLPVACSASTRHARQLSIGRLLLHQWRPNEKHTQWKGTDHGIPLCSTARTSSSS